jgi:hypothetical protein
VLRAAFAAAERGGLGSAVAAPLLGITRRTVFEHFCAGEALADCERVATQFRGAGVRLIVDHSVEEREAPEDWASNLAAKKALLRDAHALLGTDVSYVPIKVTALASPALLETMTAAIVAHPDEAWLDAEADPTAALDGAECALLASALDNLGSLCEEAARVGVPLLLDAEQSHRQPAIDYLARRLMRRFNGQRPVLFNTYQLYLRGAGRRVERDVADARLGGYAFAAKLVRGAYIASEAARARELGVAPPTQPSKEATDAASAACVAAMLRHVAADAAALVVATHNHASVGAATEAMAAHGLPPGHAGVHFAQIMGMCNGLTLSLGAAGHNAHMLVLFGSFGEVFPWLLRRLDENADVMGAGAVEQPLLERELAARLLPLVRRRF